MRPCASASTGSRAAPRSCRLDPHDLRRWSPRIAKRMQPPTSSIQLTLVVDEWRDPVIPFSGVRYTRGELHGRLVVWSYDTSQVICAAEVEATNAAELPIVRHVSVGSRGMEPSDDPLNRGRVDLVEQALRAAIPRLRAVARSVDRETATLMRARPFVDRRIMPAWARRSTRLRSPGG